MFEVPTKEKIKLAREFLGLTQQNVADIIGKKVLTIKRYEKGDTKMPAGLWLLFKTSTGYEEPTV